MVAGRRHRSSASAGDSPGDPGPLERYDATRNFGITPEPAVRALPERHGKVDRSFVIQKHWASRLHYDFRLEADGVLLSWAVPKGPCYDPKAKRMAVHVEDHPLDYASFEGTIPAKQYGAGDVIVWDRGTWEPIGDAAEGMTTGKLVFSLHGEKLAGLWELVRISKPGEKQDRWMLFKKRDEWAKPLSEYDVLKALPDSVVTHPLGLIEEREPKVAPPRAETPVAPDLSAAVRAPLPATIEPQLATLAPSLPVGGDWITETKLDGYRLLARIEGGEVCLLKCSGHNWAAKFPTLVGELEALEVSTAWLDGEIVMLTDGLPDFSALQNAMDARTSGDIVYFLFDLMYVDGEDLRRVPLWARRARLSQLLESAGEHLRFSEAFDAPAAAMFEAAASLGIEGLMLKRRDAHYESGRTQTWLKAKARLRQDLVICGFTTRGGKDGEIGSLLLGYYDDGAKLVGAGSVGTGWNARSARDLWERLTTLETRESPYDVAVTGSRRWSRREAGGERWVKPQLVARWNLRSGRQTALCGRPRSRASDSTSWRRPLRARAERRAPQSRRWR